MPYTFEVCLYEHTLYFRATYKGHTYLVRRISASLFVGEDKEEVYPIEIYRNRSIQVKGIAFKTSDGPSIFMLDYSEIPGFKSSCGYYPDIIFADSFLNGDIISTEINIEKKLCEGAASWIKLFGTINGLFNNFIRSMKNHPTIKLKVAGWPIPTGKLPDDFVFTREGAIIVPTNHFV